MSRLEKFGEILDGYKGREEKEDVPPEIKKYFDALQELKQQLKEREAEYDMLMGRYRAAATATKKKDAEINNLKNLLTQSEIAHEALKDNYDALQIRLERTEKKYEDLLKENEQN